MDKGGLNFLALSSEVANNSLQAPLIDDSNSACTDLKINPAIFIVEPKSSLLNIGILTPSGLDIGVRYVVPEKRTFTCNLAYFRHDHFLLN